MGITKAETPESTSPWTKEKVDQLIMYFNDTKRVPEDDEEGMRELIVDFIKFERIVDAGGIQPGEATRIAKGFVNFGRDWYAKHPVYGAAYEELKASMSH